MSTIKSQKYQKDSKFQMPDSRESTGEDHKNYLHIRDSLNENTDDSKAQSQKQN
jgi:hypothetical protein